MGDIGKIEGPQTRGLNLYLDVHIWRLEAWTAWGIRRAKTKLSSKMDAEAKVREGGLQNWLGLYCGSDHRLIVLSSGAYRECGQVCQIGGIQLLHKLCVHTPVTAPLLLSPLVRSNYDCTAAVKRQDVWRRTTLAIITSLGTPKLDMIAVASSFWLDTKPGCAEVIWTYEVN
jgi:hypothetical protein